MRRLLTSLLPTLAMIAGVVGGILLSRAFPVGEIRQQDAALLTSTVAYVASHYVDPVSRHRLVDGAIEGMFNRLDDHSRYLEPAAMHKLQSEAHGQYAGIGIEVSLVNGYFTVVSTVTGSPAERSDVRPGDRIKSVDGKSVKGLRLGDLVQLLRGPSGTRFALGLQRGEAMLNPILLREHIRFASVHVSDPVQGIPLLRISVFHDRTAREIHTAIERQKAASGGMRGLILDLRGNPGGTLPSAVAVSDLFLDSGIIVRTAGRSADSHSTYSATPGDVLEGLPVGVLIDGGTASAAEVVAAALQDHHRSLMFGTRSYGKGSVQTLFGVPGERGIKLTTARYFAPSGRSIDGIGVQPDVIWNGEYDALPAHAKAQLLSSVQPSAAR
jgi:carboxyl-terminal processing protease